MTRHDDATLLWPRVSTEHRIELAGLRISEVSAAPHLAIARHTHEMAYVRTVLDGDLRNAEHGAEELAGAHHHLFRPADSAHTSLTGPRGARTLTVEMESPWIEQATQALAWPLAAQRLAHGGVAALMRRLLRELRVPQRCSPLMVEGLALELLAEVLRHAASSRCEEAAIRRALELLHDEPARQWTAATIAAAAGLPPARMAAAFRAGQGRSLGEYLRALRVEYVRARLSTEQPLAELALEAGFADQAHCTRLFKQLVGQTPGSYRAALSDGRRRFA